MTKPDDTIRVLIPLKVRKKNGRPKIMPPADYRPSEDQTQDPHILRAIGRAWGWRRRMDAGEFATIQELAEAVALAEKSGVSFETRLVRGQVAQTILKAATDRDCDQIILGSKGRSALRDLLIGSVAQRVIAMSTIPVTIIK